MIEFLAIGARAVRRSRSVAGQQVLVVGAGPIGMAVAIFATATGASVVMLDPPAHRLVIASAYLAVAVTVQLDHDNKPRLSILNNGNGFDVVFDLIGNA